MIHAINPYGMSHKRRFTEENIDLNRNFRDFKKPTPANPDYDLLANAIAPESVSFCSEVSSWGQILWGRTWGSAKVTEAIHRGQYTHREGLFYGGTAPAWAHTTLLSILGKHAGNAKRVVMVDVHTGLMI